jgi:hypothetical protein
VFRGRAPGADLSAGKVALNSRNLTCSQLKRLSHLISYTVRNNLGLETLGLTYRSSSHVVAYTVRNNLGLEILGLTYKNSSHLIAHTVRVDQELESLELVELFTRTRPRV